MYIRISKGETTYEVDREEKRRVGKITQGYGVNRSD